MAENDEAIRARRIELTNGQGDTTLVLDGGNAAEGGPPALVVYGPDGPVSSATLTVQENGIPALGLRHPSGRMVTVAFDPQGNPAIFVQEPHGESRLVPL